VWAYRLAIGQSPPSHRSIAFTQQPLPQHLANFHPRISRYAILHLRVLKHGALVPRRPWGVVPSFWQTTRSQVLAIRLSGGPYIVADDRA
jgi:hypothetical protein